MILVVGFSLSVDECIAVPKLEPGGHYRGRLLARQAAGKSVNVARTLGRLGVPCTLAGFVGSGEAEYFRRSLEGLPVDGRLIPVDAVTRRATTILIEGTGEEVHVTYPSFPVAAEAVSELREIAARLAGEGDIVAVSGSLAPGVEPGELRAMLEAARAAGARTYVDTSGPGLAAAVEARPDGVRINADELAGWHAAAHGRTGAGVDAQVAALLEAGAGAALISDGEAEALLAGAGATVRALCRVDGPVHTVGAGDAQFAGWLAALGRGEAGPRDQLGFAVAVASAKLRHAMAGEVDPADVEACLARVEYAA